MRTAVGAAISLAICFATCFAIWLADGGSAQSAPPAPSVLGTPLAPSAFTAFAGLHAGSVVGEARALFGAPSREFEGNREHERCLEFPLAKKRAGGFLWSVIVCHEQASPQRITAVQTNHDGLAFLRAHHAADPKLALYGNSRRQLVARLGEPDVVSPDGANLQWRFAGGRVAITADNLRGWRTESIEVEWVY